MGIVTISVVLIPGEPLRRPIPGPPKFVPQWRGEAAAMAVSGIDLGKYKLGWHDTEQYVNSPRRA